MCKYSWRHLFSTSLVCDCLPSIFFYTNGRLLHSTLMICVAVWKTQWNQHVFCGRYLWGPWLKQLGRCYRKFHPRAHDPPWRKNDLYTIMAWAKIITAHGSHDRCHLHHHIGRVVKSFRWFLKNIAMENHRFESATQPSEWAMYASLQIVTTYLKADVFQLSHYLHILEPKLSLIWMVNPPFHGSTS